MSRLQSALSLALIALIGFLRLTWQLGQKRNKILFASEFLGLDPDGRVLPRNPGGRGASPAGDTGSGLDPDGK